MKKTVILFWLCISISFHIYSQASAMICCRNTGTTAIVPIADTVPGFSPRQNFMPCAIQGQPVSDTLYLTNYSSFTYSGIPVTMDSLRIDSIYTPSGLCWMTNSPTNTIGRGATGVVLITGATNDSAGQYKLRIIVTAFTNFGTFVENAESVDLIYKLRVRDGSPICSCPPVDNTRADSALVFIPYPACVLTATISPSGSDTICQGDSVALTANSGTGFTYLWSDSAQSTGPTIRVGSAGQYTVTVYYGGDTAVSTPTTLVIANTPGAALTLTGPDSICPGTIDTITAPQGTGYSYRWNTNDTTQSIYVHSAGTFTVTVTSLNGCSAISSPQAITASFFCPGPPVAQVTLSGHDTICPGDSVILSALAGYGYTFRWSDAAQSTTDTITVTTGGAYYVTVYHAGDSTVSAPITIILDSPGTHLTLSGPAHLCTGDSVTISAPAGLSYIWSTHATTRSITVDTSGSYTVTVTNGRQCTAISSPELITASARPTATWSPWHTVLCINLDQFDVLYGASPAGGIFSGQYVSNDTFYNPGHIGSYWIKYTFTDSNQCSNSDSVNFSSTICGGISDVHSHNPVSISPNPNEGLFTLDAPDRVGSYYVIADEAGRIVQKKIIQSESSLVDASSLRSGVYYLTVKNAQHNETIHFVIMK
jgi:hypothetical protein